MSPTTSTATSEDLAAVTGIDLGAIQQGATIKAVYVYEAPVRLWHWINALSITVLAITGYFIGSPLPTQPGEASAHFLMGYIRFAHFAAGYALAVGLAVGAPYLPMFTPGRAAAFRAVRWAAMAVMLVLSLGWSWLMFSCVWPVIWVEWQRVALRRKLPVAQWPKGLYV